jgi:NAD(P)-dependent dehydrogenase (short-subunit alcohol dehydrogenase family)
MNPASTVEPDAFRRVIETNLIGVFHTVRAALPSIIDQRGYVLVVASVSSYTAVPGMAAYGASKAGVEQFANVLRIELAHHGVGVGSAHMSLVDTPMLRETQSSSRGFTMLLAALPGPLRRTVTADRCAVRLVDAIEHRKRHVDVPRWVAAARWLKPVLPTPLAERPLSQQVLQIEALDAGSDHIVEQSDITGAGRARGVRPIDENIADRWRISMLTPTPEMAGTSRAQHRIIGKYDNFENRCGT